nr:PD-(D/E)XK nuclease family protein [Evansella tamaricis]
MTAGKLEKLAQCPYAYFLQEILRVKPAEEMTYHPNVWLDAATRGSLIHRIFEMFYRRLKERGEKPSYSIHEEVILAIANEVILAQREELPPPSNRVFDREVSDILHCCRIFLKEEEEYCKHYDPEHFEYRFGIDDIPPAEIKFPSGETIAISGIIDRVDKSSSGHYQIIDYKTGSTYNYSEKESFKGGRQLQHFIYALAIEQHLTLDSGSVIESSYYFPTTKGLGERYVRKQDDNLRKNGLDILEKLIDVLKYGHFTMTDDLNDCKFCDYKAICRRDTYGESIIERKQMSEAEGIRKFKGVRVYE